MRILRILFLEFVEFSRNKLRISLRIFVTFYTTDPSHANFARLTPFGARKDWTRGVTRHFVALAVLKEVVPKGRRSAFRPQRHSHLREDGRAAVVHIRHVRQPRRNAVPGAEALESVLFFALRTEPIHVCVRDGA